MTATEKAAATRTEQAPRTEKAAKPRNKRTLKKRIRRIIYLATFIVILLFTLSLFGAAKLLFKPAASAASDLISTSIARDLNTPGILQSFGMKSLAAFDQATPERQREIRAYMETLAQFEHYFGSGEKGKDLPEGPTGLRADDDSMHLQDIVFLRVTVNGKDIYTNNMEGAMVDTNTPFVGGLLRYYDVHAEKPLYDETGKPIGTVTAGIVPEVTLFFFMGAATFIIALCLVAMLVSYIVSRIFTIPIIKPLDQLRGQFRMMAEEDFEIALDKPLAAKRPLREIESMIDSTNRIMQKMKGYADLLRHQKATLEDQNDELEAQNQELVASKEQLQEAQAMIEQRERKLSALLDNAGQGFLTFGPDLVVEPEYSRECAELFRQEIGGAPFPELISGADEEQRIFLANVLAKLFQERDAQKRALYMPLLAEEFDFAGRHIQASYKFIADGEREGGEKAMVVLTDITEKRGLEKQMERERSVLKMIVRIVASDAEFVECVKEFRRFCDAELEGILGRDQPVKDKLLEVYRDFHTFKGNFAQLGMVYVVDHLHGGETEIASLIRRADALSTQDVAQALRAMRPDTWLDDDLRVLDEHLGEQFLRKDSIVWIDKARLVEIEQKMLSVLSPVECRLLLPELRKLRYKPFKELLKSYPDYVVGLAERMDKIVQPFAIEGDDFPANAETLYGFTRSLVHVFRNAVDHGIEPPDDRAAAGKEEAGRIRCSVSLAGGRIVMEIADDGGGIDVARLRAKAAELGLTPEDGASEEELMALIFRDEFSTKSDVTDLSGRGIGLSAVKAEVEALGGTVSVASEAGAGTTFRFELPHEDYLYLPRLDDPLALQPVIGVAAAHFRDQVGVALGESGAPEDEPHEGDMPAFVALAGSKLPLKKVTSFLQVKGAMDGMFVLSVDEPLSRAILQRMVLERLSPEEEDAYIEDALAETANIIFGNSIKWFRDFEEYVMMESPITIYTDGASVRYNDAAIWTCEMSSGQGALSLSLIIRNKPDALKPDH